TRAPRAWAATIPVAWVNQAVLGLYPHNSTHPVCSSSGVARLSPKVNCAAALRCHPQISLALQLLGLPKVWINRSIQGLASAIAVPAGVVTLNATVSGPYASARRRRVVAVRSRASSQLRRCHPGSG